MRKRNTTIEINGHRYDAVTGAKLEGTGHHAAPQSQVKKVPVRDDEPAAKPAGRQASRQTARHTARRRTTSSRTLMRQGLKKPKPALKRGQKAHGPAGALVPHYLNEVSLDTDHRLDEKRLRHAKQIRRSNLISHFLPATASSDKGSRINVKTRPVQAVRSQTAHAKPESAKPPATADMLEQAVKQATSHLQPPPKHHRRHERLKRTVGAGAAIGLSVVLFGIIVVQNSANVRLQMASAKAGFDVSLPNYRPGGYTLGQLNYSDGVAAAEFTSQNSHYTVTQKQTKWDDLDLRNKFVAPSYEQYRTVFKERLVIYLYGDRNATWVDGGIWYIIQTDGSLSDEKLVRLATSF